MTAPKPGDAPADKPAAKPAAAKSAETVPPAPRGRIYDNITQTIGGTPLVRLPRFSQKHNLHADIVAKLEFFNPLGSIKDRVGLAMIEEAERAGLIKPGKTVLIEPTGGNTGMALAFVAASKGYRLMLVMPENVAFEQRKMLAFLGAEVMLTPADLGMKGAVEKAKKFIEDSKKEEKSRDGKEKVKDEFFMFNQFENQAAAQIHARVTAHEIWEDTGGKADILIAGVGTAATITGITLALKKRKPGFKSFAVEPAESPVLSGGKFSQHPIQGIGAGFIPPLLDMKSVDGVVKVTGKRAFEVAREVAALDGIAGGISSGAALAAALDVARLPDSKGKMIVVILPSFAERYISSGLFLQEGGHA